MLDSADAFDPYHKWLGIPPREQPPNHYRLLSIELFENDPDVITNAADRQMAHLRTFQAGPHSVESQRLLNELSAARLCLLNSTRKRLYDAALASRLAPAPTAPPVQPPPVAARQQFTHTFRDDTNVSDTTAADEPASERLPQLVPEVRVPKSPHVSAKVFHNEASTHQSRSRQAIAPRWPLRAANVTHLQKFVAGLVAMDFMAGVCGFLSPNSAVFPAMLSLLISQIGIFAVWVVISRETPRVRLFACLGTVNVLTLLLRISGGGDSLVLLPLFLLEGVLIATAVLLGPRFGCRLRVVPDHSSHESSRARQRPEMSGRDRIAVAVAVGMPLVLCMGLRIDGAASDALLLGGVGAALSLLMILGPLAAQLALIAILVGLVRPLSPTSLGLLGGNLLVGFIAGVTQLGSGAGLFTLAFVPLQLAVPHFLRQGGWRLELETITEHRLARSLDRGVHVVHRLEKMVQEGEQKIPELTANQVLLCVLLARPCDEMILPARTWDPVNGSSIRPTIRSLTDHREDRRWRTLERRFPLIAGLLLAFILARAIFQPSPPPYLGPRFTEAIVDVDVDTEVHEFEVGETPIEPTELTTETLVMADAPEVDTPERSEGLADRNFVAAGGEIANDVSSIGGLGFDVKAIGLGPQMRGGIAMGASFGKNEGAGGAGVGFGYRAENTRRAMLASGGGTKQSERAVAAALNWLSRHQNSDGGWGLDSYPHECKDPSCTEGLPKRGNPGTSDIAATAMALLPFLAAGQTHKKSEPYQKTIYAGMYWLLKTQKSDGDLRGSNNMYAHGLATIALCEAYGLSQDRQVGAAAQQAINYICAVQDPIGGGWRYTPKQPGDTSVTGWQVMALKSGMMAGLAVPNPSLENAHRFLKSVSAGAAGGFFGYTDPGRGQTTTAVGLLCKQYMGAQRQDAGLQEGIEFLTSDTNAPDPARKRIYYYYYATQVLHNLPGQEWDQWNRAMRRLLIDSQETKGCATGSWNPTGDPHADLGGRIMATSLSCLTLQIYYRYRPLYKPRIDAVADGLE